jgi:transposase-like protein
LADVEIMARVERRRKWTATEKSALLAEVEAEGGKVAVVARRHRISESVLYNWRAAGRAAAAMQAPAGAAFIPLGVFGGSDDRGLAMLAAPERPRPRRASDGGIEIALPNGALTRGIYNKAEYEVQRRHMMQEWSDIIDARAAGKKRVPVLIPSSMPLLEPDPALSQVASVFA